jgi:hypothetical protein
MMSLLVFHRLGGGTLEIGSQNFRDRAQRLRALRVMQVDDVIVEARVSGTDRIIEKFGEGADHDLYLQEPTSARPVLFHDFQMVGWPRVVRQRLAPHIAALVENPAYADTFALLFQLDEPSAREVFLQERGITPEDLDRVRAALQTVGIVASREARCWWQAMLHLLGADPHVPQEDAHLESHICTAMAAVGQAPELIDTLLEGRDIQAVRTDTSPSGVLAMLEKHGFSLQKLDCLLRKSGDPGLQIRVAADWLERWKSTYGRHIAWLLYQHGWSAERAKAAPGQWRVPEHLAWCIVLPEGEVLRDVLNDLHQAGLTPDAQQLAGPEPLSYLAALAKEPDLDAFTSRWRELYDPETQRRLRHEWALAWRLLLVPVLVATGSQPGDHSTRLFTEAERIDKALPPSPQSATELVACVFDLLHAHPALAAKLAERLREDTPPPADLTWISSLVDHEHLDHVRRLLARAPRQQVTHLCQQVVQLQALGIHPTTYYDTRNPILLPVPSPSTYCKEVQARRHHRDAARLNRLGARAEEWALSAVIDPLLALKFSERQSIIHQLVDALRMAYKGKVVERLIGRAQTAMAEDISEEDCLEALIGFLHLSRESDEFGCDLLGWLASSPNASPRPLFLEVKSDHDRRFPVSRAEWERAKVLKDAYAFFVVERSQDDQDGQTVPQRMVILPNPVQLHADQRLGLDPDTWRVSYGSSEF